MFRLRQQRISQFLLRKELDMKEIDFEKATIEVPLIILLELMRRAGIDFEITKVTKIEESANSTKEQN